MGDNIGNLYYPGNMLPFTRGGGKGCRPLPDLMETGWEGGGSCSALCPHAQAKGGGEGAGRTTLWEENSSNDISIKNNVINHLFLSNILFSVICTTEKKQNPVKHLLFNFFERFVQKMVFIIMLSRSAVYGSSQHN